VIECGNESGVGGEEKGGCHVPSCDYFGIGDGEVLTEGSIMLRKRL
jgi:hypothetical protein